MPKDPLFDATTPAELTEQVVHLFQSLMRGEYKHLLTSPDVGQQFLDMAVHAPATVGDWTTDIDLMRSSPGENVAWVGRNGHQTATIRVAQSPGGGKIQGFLEVSGEEPKMFALDL